MVTSTIEPPKKPPIALPRLEDYSAEQVKELRLSLSAPDRYLNIIKTQNTNATSDRIRIRRHYYWLRCVFATFFNTNTTEEITEFWSQSAKKLIIQAYKESNLCSFDVSIFAIGKLGASELNLSSDVDLMLIIDDGSQNDETKVKGRTKSLKIFQNLLQESTSFSFALRVDFDLRPGGRLGPLFSTSQQFEDYYGNFGETWERLALIRLLPIIGNEETINNILTTANKFTFRKHLNFSLIDDLKELRPKIHLLTETESKPQRIEEFNLKLGVGGIRDIELFIHSLQVLHGGRDKELQKKQTEDAIQQLNAKQILSKDDSDFFSQSYWQLRDLENRIQASHDQQNHVTTFDSSLKEYSFIFSHTNVQELKILTNKIDTLVSTLLGKVKTLDPSSYLPDEIDEQKQWLSNKGFSQQTINDVWSDLITTKARSKNQKRDERSRKIFLQSFINKLTTHGVDKDLGLRTLKDFINSTKSKTSYYSFFNHNPLLIENLVYLFSVSPYLGQILSSRPELIDNFFFRSQRESFTDIESLLSQLSERRLVSDLVAASDFLRQKNIPLLLFGLSLNADEIIGELLSFLKRDPQLKNSSLNILTLGKWAGFELGFRSDLDFIFVTEKKICKEDHRLAKKIISYLSAPTSNGIIYPLDLRLRPSGSAGPLIVSKDSLLQFLKSEAKAWQRQAYTKSRFIQETDSWIKEAASSLGLNTDDFTELKDIRQQLRKEHLPIDNERLIDIKYHHGGFIDIEFAIQTALLELKIPSYDVSTLAMLKTLSQHSPQWSKEKDFLSEKYNQLRLLEQLYQLATHQVGSIIDIQSDNFNRLSMIYEYSPEVLRIKIQKIFSDVQQKLSSLDPIERAR